MLISDSHRFIFVQMRKVASSSMQAVLKPLAIARPEGKLAHLLSRAGLQRDYRKHFFRAHDDLLAARKRMPATRFENYFKFSFVRNPWARLVSEYEYILARPAHGRHKRVAALNHFTDFIQMQIPRRDAYQVNMLCDSEGSLLTDFVGRLENLEADWKAVCERLGLGQQSLNYQNTTRHRPYREYFEPESIQLVRRHWKRDIESFDYHFDAA